jgi:hypothetical protein
MQRREMGRTRADTHLADANMIPTVQAPWQLIARTTRSPALGIAVITWLAFASVTGAATSSRLTESPASTGARSAHGSESTPGFTSRPDPRFTAGLGTRPSNGSDDGTNTEAPLALGPLPGMPNMTESAELAEQPANSPGSRDVPHDPDLAVALSGINEATPEQLLALQQGIEAYAAYRAQLRPAEDGAALPATTPVQSVHGMSPAALGPELATDPGQGQIAAPPPDVQPFPPTGAPPEPAG